MSTNNINLEQVLSETIVSSKKAVGEAVEWALKQVPETCDQYLKYEMFSVVVNATLAAMLGILIVVVWSKLWKWFGKINKNDEDGRITARFVSSFIGLMLMATICVPLFVLNLKTAVKIAIAPKVYLVEFAAKLVK